MYKIDERTRTQIAAFLPDAIQTAIQSYQDFADEQVTIPCDKDKKATNNTSKNFKDHHDACKVAIAHIELLLKLAKWADIPQDEISHTDFAQILNKANVELERK